MRVMIMVVLSIFLTGCYNERCVIEASDGSKSVAKNCTVTGSSILCNPQNFLRTRYADAWSNYRSATCEMF